METSANLPESQLPDTGALERRNLEHRNFGATAKPRLIPTSRGVDLRPIPRADRPVPGLFACLDHVLAAVPYKATAFVSAPTSAAGAGGKSEKRQHDALTLTNDKC